MRSQVATPTGNALTQARLFSLDKKAFVTPRSSTPKKTATPQTKLTTVFHRQQLASTYSSSSRALARTQTGKENDGSSSSGGENERKGKAKRTSSTPSTFGPLSTFTPSSSKARSTPHLGQRMINSTPSQRRVGPTIDFDDEAPPANSAEMEGEEDRKKKRRVLWGARGQLDFSPAGDHEGFGGEEERGSSRKRARKELVMSTEGEEQEEDEADEEEVVVVHGVDSDQEGDTEDEAEPVPPPTRTVKVFDATPMDLSSDDSAQDDEEMQRSLVPSWPRKRGHKSIVLVPDSEEENDNESDGSDDESGILARRMGGGVDDSGFMEGGIESPIAKKDVSRLASNECVASPSPVLSRSLERSASGIAMPPPPVPLRRASAPRVSRILVEDTQVTLPTSVRPVVPFQVICEETQYSEEVDPESFEDAAAYEEESQIVPRGTGRLLVPDTQDAGLVDDRISSRPVASTSTATTPAPKRKTATNVWLSIEQAWEGQHIEPFKPAPLRQGSLMNWCIHDDTVIQDSQDTGLSLEEAYLFELARESRREMKGKGPVVPTFEGEDDIEEEEDADDEATVPSSDQENDGPWSPLCSPSPRSPHAQSFFDHISSKLSSTRPSPVASPSHHAPILEAAPHSSSKSEGEDQDRPATQYESYWSFDNSDPGPIGAQESMGELPESMLWLPSSLPPSKQVVAKSEVDERLMSLEEEETQGRYDDAD